MLADAHNLDCKTFLCAIPRLIRNDYGTWARERAPRRSESVENSPPLRRRDILEAAEPSVNGRFVEEMTAKLGTPRQGQAVARRFANECK
jgi:hypothetical protein